MQGLYNEHNCIPKSIHAIEWAIFLVNKLIRYKVHIYLYFASRAASTKPFPPYIYLVVCSHCEITVIKKNAIIIGPLF